LPTSFGGDLYERIFAATPIDLLPARSFVNQPEPASR
jgi:hypothetical protein